MTPISPSFHARDVLAPAAAHLSAGVDLEKLGAALDPASLAEFRIPEPTVEHAKIECEVLDLNRFGNVLLNVRESQLVESGLDGADAIQIDATSGSGRAERVCDLRGRRIRRLGAHRRSARMVARHTWQSCKRRRRPRQRLARRPDLAYGGSGLEPLV